MNDAQRILALLVSLSGDKIQGYKVAEAVGLTPDTFAKRAWALVKYGHVTREKIEGSGSPFYWYYLDERQQRNARMKIAVLQVRSKPGLAVLKTEPSGITLVTDTDDIHDRLAFLRMLKEKTVFGEHAMLDRVIEDYTRTLRLREACKQRAEGGSEQPRKKPMTKTSAVSLNWKHAVSTSQGQ